MNLLSTLLSMMLFALPYPALAAPQNWELCLDKADFSYDLYENILAGTSIMVSKAACKVVFSVSGGKGEKFAIDLCDPQIHLDYYPAIDASSPRHIQAGNAGCPAPGFGADFDENAKDYNDYKEMRARIFEMFDKVKAFHGEGWDKVDINKPGSFSPEISAARIACGQFLLNEYLKRCMSFEPKKPEAGKDTTKSDIPGVHPQTILVPKK